MSVLTLVLLALGPVGFSLGWAFGYGKAKEINAGEIAEQSERLAHLAAEIKALEFEIMALASPAPDAERAGRVLDILSDPDREA